MQRYSLFYLETALHVSDSASTHHQERIQLYLHHLVFVTPLLLTCRYRGRVGTGLSVLWVAYTVVCAPDDGWRHYPKHVKQFPDKINFVTLHLVGYILEYSYNARAHKRDIKNKIL
jgi:hypothetical protein